MEHSRFRAYFRFYAELNEHLPVERRFQTLETALPAAAPVKDLIESFGVPHGEVELIIAGGESVGFDYLVRNGDRVAVYPMFESFDLTNEVRVRRAPLREPRFVMDADLDGLAAELRLLGFDSLCRSSANDAELVRISCEQGRILLTRDRGLLKHNAITHGYCVRESDRRRQLAEVLDRFDLAGSIRGGHVIGNPSRASN